MATRREPIRGYRNPRLLWKGGWSCDFKGPFLLKESMITFRRSKQEGAFSITCHLLHCAYGETETPKEEMTHWVN